MHAPLIAFILYTTATILAGIQRAWPIALIAAGLAVTLIPVVFNT
jgi:hypothetical protein